MLFTKTFLRSCLLSFFVFVAIATAQQKEETYKILGISVEGQRAGDPAAIIANTGLKIGDAISLPGEQTRKAIEHLYNLKLFDDVQILVENRVSEGVYLLIRVKENPRLEKIIIKGNDELSEDDILKKVSLVKGQIVTTQSISAFVRALKTQYESDGYLNAEIKTSLVPVSDSSSRVNLHLDVDEGPKIKVDDIFFHGNKRFDDGDLKGEMKETTERRWWRFWTTNKFDQKKYKDDKDLIIAFYHKNGFRDAEILSDSLSYDKSKKYLTINIWVNEGPQYFIRNIRWEGNTVYTSDILSDCLKMKAGDVFNQEKFDQNLHRNEQESDVTSLYADNGYLWFQVEPDIKVVSGDSLDITMQVRERNQFRLGRVIISGNTKTYEKVIRRELLTKPGDYFSRQLIIRSIRQLSQLNYFNSEKIKPDVRPVDDKTVELEYSVEEKSSDTFNMSVGYSGAFGFSGGLGLTFNNFSVTEPFRGGAGQVLTFDWQFGVNNYYRNFSIGFQEPWMFDTPTLFGVNLFDTYQSYYADLHYTGVSLRVGRRFKWPDMYFRGDWTLTVQQNEYHPLSTTTTDSYYYMPEGKATQIGITQVFSRSSEDSPIFPSRGSSFSLLTSINDGPKFGGSLYTARYNKDVFSAEYYIPIANSSRVTIMSSATVGTIFGFEENPYIPYQDLFWMGGTGLGQIAVTPLRGYDDRSIGPSDGNVGGKAMMKYTTEMRFALTLEPIPIYTLLFAEAGNVWLTPSMMDPTDLRRSAGFGVRLMIQAIGMVGFDYGYGYDASTPKGSAPGWKFHFQFGKSM
ncbi:MAG TPA: outer membrane protein assembly factor BamA [Bacteroidota bacterium]|nr:outer membrane protein assembly factor BamA [Bacteroidota bacterium]